MNVHHALSLIPADRLANGLRVNEDAVLGEVRGDIWALQACYRLLARILKGMDSREPRRLLVWDELPPRMQSGRECACRGKQGIHRVTRRQFTAIRERMESMVLEAGEHYIKLRPYDQMEMFRDRASVDDREARIRFYQRQIRWLEQQYELSADASSRQGPKKRPVIARDDQGNVYGPFESTRKAAEWVRTGGIEYPEGVNDKLAAEWSYLHVGQRWSLGLLSSIYGRGQQVIADSVRAHQASKSRTPAYCRRSDIRTAIRKHHRCCGLVWAYTEAEKPKRDRVKETDQLALFAA